jgi:hypothetical protein
MSEDDGDAFLYAFFHLKILARNPLSSLTLHASLSSLRLTIINVSCLLVFAHEFVCVHESLSELSTRLPDG